MNSRPLPYQGSALPLSYCSAWGGILAIPKSGKRNLDGFSPLGYVPRMSRKPDSGKAGKASPREDRLKAALKANLQRRKAQAEARSGKDKNEKAG